MRSVGWWEGEGCLYVSESAESYGCVVDESFWIDGLVFCWYTVECLMGVDWVLVW